MQLIRELINHSIKELRLPKVEYAIEHPKNESHGDYSCNIAMILWGTLKVRPSLRKELTFGSPRELAEKLVEQIYKDPFFVKTFEKVEVAGAGFINFYLKPEFFLEQTKKATETGYGRNESGRGKLAIVEYSSPNIAKPFTIGHLRSTVIGDAVANILELNGWKVMRDNHLGDWGTQFGKQIAAIKKWGDEKKNVYTVKELVELYVRFHKEAEDNPGLDDEARAWFKKLEDGDGEARAIWKMCVDSSWKEFSRIYELLGISDFDFNEGRGYGESFFEDKMGEVLKMLDKQDWYKEGKEGAKLVFFPNDKYSPAMILKKDGATLYHTRDLATDKYRLDKYHPDLVVNEVGMEQQLYFQQLYEIEKMLGWYSGAQRVHVMHGMFRFKEGKMSTRKGNVIWLEEVLGEAIKRAGELGKEGKNVAEDVGIGALKWNDLKGEARRDIVFDWEEILNMKGNSGPYIQYTYVRALSVLNKFQAPNSKLQTNSNDINLKTEELAILRWLYRYPEVVAEAGEKFAPHLISTYIYELAARFNTFYQVCRVEENGEINELRYLLTKATENILQSGLGLLGIVAPEEM